MLWRNFSQVPQNTQVVGESRVVVDRHFFGLTVSPVMLGTWMATLDKYAIKDGIHSD